MRQNPHGLDANTPGARWLPGKRGCLLLAGLCAQQADAGTVPTRSSGKHPLPWAPSGQGCTLLHGNLSIQCGDSVRAEHSLDHNSLNKKTAVRTSTQKPPPGRSIPKPGYVIPPLCHAQYVQQRITTLLLRLSPSCACGLSSKAGTNVTWLLFIIEAHLSLRDTKGHSKITQHKDHAHHESAWKLCLSHVSMPAPGSHARQQDKEKISELHFIFIEHENGPA